MQVDRLGLWKTMFLTGGAIRFHDDSGEFLATLLKWANSMNTQWNCLFSKDGSILYIYLRTVWNVQCIAKRIAIASAPATNRKTIGMPEQHRTTGTCGCCPGRGCSSRTGGTLPRTIMELEFTTCFVAEISWSKWPCSASMINNFWECKSLMHLFFNQLRWRANCQTFQPETTLRTELTHRTDVTQKKHTRLRTASARCDVRLETVKRMQQSCHPPEIAESSCACCTPAGREHMSTLLPHVGGVLGFAQHTSQQRSCTWKGFPPTLSNPKRPTVDLPRTLCRESANSQPTPQWVIDLSHPNPPTDNPAPVSRRSIRGKTTPASSSTHNPNANLSQDVRDPSAASSAGIHTPPRAGIG